jgi:hypothetical protein
LQQAKVLLVNVAVPIEVGRNRKRTAGGIHLSWKRSRLLPPGCRRVSHILHKNV